MVESLLTNFLEGLRLTRTNMLLQFVRPAQIFLGWEICGESFVSPCDNVAKVIAVLRFYLERVPTLCGW